MNPPKRFRTEAVIIGTLSASLLLAAWRQWLPLDVTEAFGFATGAICVWLITRENLWNWPIGLINNLVFAVLFWKTRLYADLGLQAVYFIMGIWGWRQWLHGGPRDSELHVSRATRAEWLAIGSFIIIGTPALRALLITINGSAPFWDALTTVLSLAAQWLLCRKRIENWFLWIVADLIYVPLYFVKSLPLISLLYAGFLLLCITGLRRWHHSLHS